MPSSTRRKRRILLAIASLAVIAIWIAGDFLYSYIIDVRVAQWESKIERDDEGVQVGSQSFSVAGGRTVLLLVHGFNDTPRAFQHMAPALADRGYSIRAVRLPGFGVGVDAMHRCTREQWVERVRREIHQLKRQFDRVLVVAHSLGAAATLGVLITQPDSVNGLVLLAPAIDVSNRRSPLLPTRAWHAVGRFVLYFSRIYESPFAGDAADPAAQQQDYRTPFTTRNLVNQTLGLMDQIQPHAEKIRIPVLMILTRNDRVVDWKAAESYFERINSPDKRLKFFDSSGHTLTVDRDWEKIVNDIDSFAMSIP